MMKTYLPAAAVLTLALCACAPAPDEAAIPAPAADVMATDPAAPPAMPADSVVTRFRAHGNEPFWSVEVDGTTLRYSRMGEEENVALQAERSAYARGVEFSGEADGQPFTLDIRGEDCANTMSDETHEFTATFEYRGETLTGCADRAE
ncbi:MAG: hypothetical protein Q4F49_01610 [Pseudoxanthomonas suwonensis]|nr:hypothetical protein [Pseudoxanthomonas suwonensis]